MADTSRVHRVYSRESSSGKTATVRVQLADRPRGRARGRYVCQPEKQKMEWEFSKESYGVQDDHGRP